MKHAAFILCIVASLGLSGCCDDELRIAQTELAEADGLIEELEGEIEVWERKYNEGLKEIKENHEQEREALLQRLQDDLEKAVACARNLEKLRERMIEYPKAFGGPDEKFPTVTGGAFWLKLTGTEPPLVLPKDKGLFFCPSTGIEPATGQTTYRGPSGDANLYRDENYLGACNPGHHPEEQIIAIRRFDHAVRFLKPDNPEYQKALNDTKK